MSQVYDTIVVGAGPGGAAAAYYLAKAGLNVLLLDKFDFPRDKTCGDGLTPLALEVLDDIGILEDMLHVGRRIKRLQIFAPAGHSTTVPIPPRHSGPGYALVVPRFILDNTIRERALARGAEFQGRIHVTNIERGHPGVVVTGRRRGRSVSIRAHMAIIATGASVKLLLTMGLLSRTPPMMVAARTYFENVAGLDDDIRFYFDGVPLPGYGWVFPLPNSSANIGAGFFRTNRRAHRMPATPQAAFERFLQIPSLQMLLARAEQAGPVKGYPLRIDFATAPTYGERVMLVGEAAGLVNPLTGEGIDYALTSGRLAAEHLIHMFATGDLSGQKLAAYDLSLRQRFQALFLFCYRLQGLLPYRPVLNRLAKAAARQTDLQTLMINILLGDQDVAKGISLRIKLKTVLALAIADFL